MGRRLVLIASVVAVMLTAPVAPVRAQEDGPEETPVGVTEPEETEALEVGPAPRNLEPIETDPAPRFAVPTAPPPRAPASSASDTPDRPDRPTRPQKTPPPTHTADPTATPTPDRASRPRAAPSTRARVPRACLARLPRLERRVLALRYGMRVPRPWSRRQVAIALRISDARVLQLERRARRRAASLRRRDACRRPRTERDEVASVAPPPAPPDLPAPPAAGPWDLGSALDVPAIIAALALILATVAVARKTWRRPPALAGTASPPVEEPPRPQQQRLWARPEPPPDVD